jgi:hypothetical protein
MKKLFFSVFIMMVLSVSIFADKFIQISQLPNTITDFMKTYFPESTIILAEYDDDKYDIKFITNNEAEYLSGEAEFSKKGDWDKIEFYLGIPEELLPTEVLSSLRKNFSDSAIVSLERDFNGFEITLLDSTELDISNEGKILEMDVNHHHKKFDKDKFDRAKKFKDSKQDKSSNSDSTDAQ